MKRSFAALARIYVQCENYGADMLEIEEEVFANIGKGKGLQFFKYLQFKDQLPSWQEIMDQGENAKLPASGNLSMAYYAGSLLLENFKRPIQQARGKENAINYLGAIGQKRPECVDVVAWVVSEIVDIATGDRALTTEARVAAQEILNVMASHSFVKDKVIQFIEKTEIKAVR